MFSTQPILVQSALKVRVAFPRSAVLSPWLRGLSPSPAPHHPAARRRHPAATVARCVPPGKGVGEGGEVERWGSETRLRGEGASPIGQLLVSQKFLGKPAASRGCLENSPDTHALGVTWPTRTSRRGFKGSTEASWRCDFRRGEGKKSPHSAQVGGSGSPHLGRAYARSTCAAR
jgi:hypothetical protein